VRAELFQNFSLGRIDSPNLALWPQPIDNSYTPIGGNPYVVNACGDDHVSPCEDKTQAGANMRLRVNPELHISDNLRIMSQLDLLDNLVLGSTPGGFARVSNVDGAFTAISNSPYVPIGALATTTAVPTTGINSIPNSIQVKRAWGEYATPVGQLRFGRMPTAWGLGILENAGDTYDSDWQSTIDRIMFTTGIKSLDLYASGTWDFPNEGVTSATPEALVGGQPYDLAQLDDVNQYTLRVVRRRDPELTKLDLARGDAVVNGGAYFAYRDQILTPDTLANTPGSAINSTAASPSNPFIRRGLHLYTPDLWMQILYRHFRFEMEGVMNAGSISNAAPNATSVDILQWGLATQTEFRAIEDRLRLGFGFGWASGDSGALPLEGRTSTLSPTRAGTNSTNLGNATTLLPRIPGSNTYSEFRFHPDYRIDLILNRNILGRVEGEYYFRPSAEYDFTRNSEGQKFGGGAAFIWTRASEPIQTPGHKPDLGLELDLSLYYQAKDGVLNDNPDKMGGFYTMLQYGVLFPLGGLGALGSEGQPDTSTAHMLRWFIGILY
jgi:uncharacterized protein (TIGR04551 family)